MTTLHGNTTSVYNDSKTNWRTGLKIRIVIFGIIFLQQSWKNNWERWMDDSLMLATIHDDTWNVLNMQHIIPNLKKKNYSDIPVVAINIFHNKSINFIYNFHKTCLTPGTVSSTIQFHFHLISKIEFQSQYAAYRLPHYLIRYILNRDTAQQKHALSN